MDLRTGETVWHLDHSIVAPAPPLDGDVTCEVAIVGGGITGVLVADALVSAGIECVLLERARIGAGSTAASTALLLYELDTSLHELSEQIGEADAAAAYRACHAAITKIEQLVGDLGDSCEFRRRKSFYLAECEADIAFLQREERARQKIGMHVDFIARGEIEALFSFSRPAALLSHDAAELNVVQLVQALLRRASARGLRAFGSTEMTRLARCAQRFIVQTNRGPTVKARRVVFATGYATNEICRRHTGDLKSTYAIATTPLAAFSGWHERALIWTTARPYLYLRTTASNRAVIGGEDVPFVDDERRDALLPAKTAALEGALRAMFPELEFEVACAWTGTFAETKDSLAYIGESPETPALYLTLGYGGNGIAYSMVAAEIIREACCGREHPDGRLFRLTR